jgi:predicted secreted Zn-dependent protease
MAAAERRLSRSLSLDALQARVDAKRQRNKKPKEKYLKALEQRRVAEGVTLDFVELSDAGEVRLHVG